MCDPAGPVSGAAAVRSHSLVKARWGPPEPRSPAALPAEGRPAISSSCRQGQGSPVCEAASPLVGTASPGLTLRRAGPPLRAENRRRRHRSLRAAVLRRPLSDGRCRRGPPLPSLRRGRRPAPPRLAPANGRRRRGPARAGPLRRRHRRRRQSERGHGSRRGAGFPAGLRPLRHAGHPRRAGARAVALGRRGATHLPLHHLQAAGTRAARGECGRRPRAEPGSAPPDRPG